MAELIAFLIGGFLVFCFFHAIDDWRKQLQKEKNWNEIIEKHFKVDADGRE